MNIENLTLVRDHLASLEDNRFSIGGWASAPDLNECGTYACIGGWAQFLLTGDATDVHTHPQRPEYLDLTEDQAAALMCPPGWLDHPDRYTRQMAVDTLTHLIETGEVQWTPSA